jgi:glutamate/tyrosine decarboxylase-like PLP-dependent enzyme
LALRIAQRLAREPGVRVLNEVQLNQLIVSFGDGATEERNALTRATIERLQDDNISFAGGADWRGSWVLRISVISAPLTEADVDGLAASILEAWQAVRTAASARQLR